jgi:hypothetical protein
MDQKSRGIESRRQEKEVRMNNQEFIKREIILDSEFYLLFKKVKER